MTATEQTIRERVAATEWPDGFTVEFNGIKDSELLGEPVRASFYTVNTGPYTKQGVNIIREEVDAQLDALDEDLDEIQVQSVAWLYKKAG